jgi:hypothetical protein
MANAVCVSDGSGILFGAPQQGTKQAQQKDTANSTPAGNAIKNKNKHPFIIALTIDNYN